MSNVPLHFRRVTAFTLIELLTVIAIIAVLMGLLFPAIGGVKEMARKAQAKNDVVGIVNGVKAYYTEYGKYPVAGATTYDNKEVGQELTNILTGVAAAVDQNPRRIAFMEIPPAKTNKAGAAPKGGLHTDKKFYDPWGTPYMISIDANYDNELTAPSGSAQVLNTGVAVYSKGKKSADVTDDVYSWK